MIMIMMLGGHCYHNDNDDKHNFINAFIITRETIIMKVTKKRRRKKKEISHK